MRKLLLYVNNNSNNNNRTTNIERKLTESHCPFDLIDNLD